MAYQLQPGLSIVENAGALLQKDGEHEMPIQIPNLTICEKVVLV